MINLIKSTRVPECLLVVVVAILGFKIAKLPINIEALVSLFFVVAATMLQNDWRDRFHDIGKGKTFAYEKPKIFLFWLVLVWLVCFAFIMHLFFIHSIVAILLTLMAFVGLIYSELRRVPFLSVIFVTFTVASTILLPIGFGSNFMTLLPLFSLSACLMFGRETLHDIADTQVDTGYKKTISVILGTRVAYIFASTSLVAGCVIAMTLQPISALGSIFIIWGLFGTKNDPRVVRVRNKVDVGLVLISLSILIF